MLPGLLGKQRIGRVARPDRVEDQRLAQVIRLGHDVPGALVVDPLETLVVVHQHDPGSARQLEREGQLVGPGGVRGPGAVAGCRDHRRGTRHGELQSAVSGLTVAPSSLMCCVNVTV